MSGPLILHIETATRVCSVALAMEGNLLSIRESLTENTHSTALIRFISEVMKEGSHDLKDLDAVAVSKGPGSYTGLRIGVSTAKGLCYALDKPLLAIGTLTSMAQGMMISSTTDHSESPLFCPMIDARRMEVYMALYDTKGAEIIPPMAEIISEESFDSFLPGHSLILSGDGAEKCRSLFNRNASIHYSDISLPSASHMIPLALDAFQKNHFEDVAYFEPFYLKDFIAGIPSVKGLK